MRPVFSGLNFRAQSGDCISVEGPNGAGKTSLLRLIAGFIAPVGGSLRLSLKDGGEISDEEERGKLAGWLGHQDALKPQLTARENLSFFAQLYMDGNGVDEAIARVGLTRQKDLPGQYLSAGQKRRLGLARLLVSKRPLWLLDEPLSALDTSGKALVVELIAAHIGAGGIVFAATHDPLGLSTIKLQLGAA
jgi:heme exporter protein A